MADPASVEERTPILRPGRNCWRIEQASRATVLIDADAYFSTLYRALLRARSTIYIVGWDLDSRLVLARDPAARDPSLPARLGPLLGALARRTPELQVHVLAWDFAPIYLFEREFLPRLKFDLSTPKRVCFHLDDQHPPGGSQHQKIVVIDDAIAFCGGLDLCDVRWDTPAHAPDDPHRVDVHGRPYRPHHDVQMAVEGAAARALGELVRERWHNATGESLPVPPPGSDPWPLDLLPDLRDVRVGIARTAPSTRRTPAVGEVEALWHDAIAAARSSIYIENPYVASDRILGSLERRLREPDGPEVVIVHPPRSNGFLENFFLRTLVDLLVDRLRAADLHGRLTILAPSVISAAGERLCVNVHGKVCIVDDAFLRIGSANLTNRSFALDRECDLAIESDDPLTRSVIAQVRARLVAEHLGATPDEVLASLARTRSLVATIAELHAERSHRIHVLEPYDPPERRLADQVAALRDVIDPEAPLSLQQIRRLFVENTEQKAYWRWIGVAWWSAMIVFVVVAKLTGLVDIGEVTSWLVKATASPGIGWLFVLATFTVGGLLLFPVTLLIINSGLFFGPTLGAAYALLGAFGSAAVYYWLGRWMGRDLVHRFAGSRLREATKAVARRGILAVAAVRLVPVAPHLVVGLAAGAARITFRDYMLGTIVAMGPGSVVLVLAGSRLSAGGSWWETVLSIAGLVVVGLGLAWLLQRLVGRGAALDDDVEEASAGRATG